MRAVVELAVIPDQSERWFWASGTYIYNNMHLYIKHVYKFFMRAVVELAVIPDQF